MSYKPPIGDASAIKKGLIQLAGDLGGTAGSPTVPGLASKLNSSQLGAANGVASLDTNGKVPSAQLSLTFPVTTVAGRTGDVTLAKTDIGLDNVDNTSDASKPVSSATQTALNGKAGLLHSHAIADVTNLQTNLDAKANQATTYTKGEVDTALSNKANTSHTHAISDTTGLQTALDGKQAAGSYAAASHTHIVTQISDSTATGRSLMTAVDAIAARTTIGAGTSSLALGTSSSTAKAGDYVPSWTEITSKPTTFAPSAHSHPISDVTNLQTTLDGKAALSHTHAATDISNSTAIGRAVLTAADAAAAQAAIGVTNTVQVVNAFVDVTTPVYGVLYVVRA